MHVLLLVLAETTMNATPDIHCVLNALGDSTRRAIVERLRQGRACVSELAALLNITPPGVSQHMLILESCGLVFTEKVGRTRFCTLQAAGFDLAIRWLSDVHSRCVQ